MLSLDLLRSTGYRSNRTRGSFIADQSAASSEDGSKVSYRWELPAADLPVRSVRVGDATCASGSAGHYDTTADFGCGAGQDRHTSTADD
jgi:hypothetical protein